MRRIFTVFLALVYAIGAGGCSPRSYLLEPTISYTPQVHHIDSLPSAFPKLTPEERSTEWGRELVIAENLACELDLYRAITAFKRAQILLPEQECIERGLQIDYGIFFSYYLGGRYQDALNVFESSDLTTVAANFPAFRELVISLYDAYMQTEQYSKAFRILELIDVCDLDAGIRLRAGDNVLIGDLPGAVCDAEDILDNGDIIRDFASDYCCSKLSVRKAQTLNAVLPGAGYYYVGQNKAAMTSFIINTLFTAAAYAFFEKGNWGAGLITTSLELGWYIGGINGAGLAAKEYNECIYNTRGKEAMIKARLFPVLLFQTSF